MLTVESLSAWYGAARILYELSFDVGRGEVVALMGRNGAGKSTTMKAVMGLLAQRKAASRRGFLLMARRRRPGHPSSCSHFSPILPKCPIVPVGA